MTNNEQFGRNIEVLFGTPGNIGNKYSDLRISFKVTKTASATPNKGEIKIYNLTQTSRALTEKKGLVMVLRAGYGNNLGDIFRGDIARSSTSLEGTDYVTTFEIGDGEKSYQEAHADLAFEAGATVKGVVQTVIDTFGKTVGDISALKDGKFLGGLSLSGMSREHLDYVTKKQGLEWSIQDDAVQIIPIDGATFETAIQLTPSTGLIEIPKKKDKGIELKCLLNPQMKPGRAIDLRSKLINGKFRCTTVTFNGDNFDKDFTCEIEADPL